MNVTNPATGEVIQTYDVASWDQMAARIGELEKGFEDWRRRPASERARLVGAAAPLLRERARRYAEMMAREMGKPVAQGRQEIEKCAWLCEYYASAGPDMLKPQPVASDAVKSWV